MKKAKTKKSKFVVIARLLISLVILAVLLRFLYIYSGKLLCHIAIRQIGDLTNTKIHADSINFQADGSVFINDIVIRPHKSQNDNADILRAKNVYARFDKRSLFLLKPRLNVIDVNDFVFNVLYDMDTGWTNLSDLTIRAPKNSFKKAPEINLKEGILQYIKITDGNETTAISIPLEADFKTEDTPEKVHIFNVTTATMSSGYGQSHLNGYWKPGSVIITGGISSLNVPQFEMAWMIDYLAAELKYDPNNNYSLKLSSQNMHSMRTSEPNGLLLEAPAAIQKFNLFAALQQFLDSYKPKGLIDINLEVNGNFKELSESELKGTLNCNDVSICYYKFPYLIEHMAGIIDFTQNGITLNNLCGKHGDSEFYFNGWYQNIEDARKYLVNITSDKMPLTDDLYEVLNEKQQTFWSSFSPEGNVSVDLQFKKESETNRNVDLTLGLLDLEAAYKNFPYPLKDLTGNLIFGQDKITVQDVVSRDGNLKLELNGEIITPEKDNSKYNISVKTNNMPLDSTLEASLSEEQRELYKQFNPSGFVNGLVQVSMSDSGETDFLADLDFEYASLDFNSLSLAVSDISAEAVLTKDYIDIKSFSGKYGDIPVSLSGRFIPDEKSHQSIYDIKLDLEKVQLDNPELSEMMPEYMKNLFDRCNLKGNVDITADLIKKDKDNPPDYGIIVKCLGNEMNMPDFPYPIKDITGTMKINQDKIIFNDFNLLLDDVSSDTEISPITINGEAALDNGILKDAEFEISAKNLLLNEKFEKVIPEHCKDLFKAMKPSGQIDIDFEKFRIVSEAENIKTIDFDGTVKLDDFIFAVSGDQAELDSTIKVHGTYITGSGFHNCKAIVNNGSLLFLGKRLTGIKSEIFYDPDTYKWSSENLVADFYGGKTTGKFDLILTKNFPAEYVLQAAFDNVGLEQFLADTELLKNPANSYTSGKMSGSLNLHSLVNDNKSRIGTCQITIKDMEVGKMSPLANILQVLNLNEPSDYAFNSMFIDSYLKRNSLYVEKLDMSGKSVAFYGSGSIDLLKGDVSLSLTARGRRLATDEPSVLGSLTEGLGRAVVRMDVSGNVRDVKVETKTLPVIEETLGILGTK